MDILVCALCVVVVHNDGERALLSSDDRDQEIVDEEH